MIYCLSGVGIMKRLKYMDGLRLLRRKHSRPEPNWYVLYLEDLVLRLRHELAELEPHRRDYWLGKDAECLT